MHARHIIISLSTIVIVFLVVVYIVVRTTSTSLQSSLQSTIPITPIPVDSAKLPEALQKIQNKARLTDTSDLQLVGAPIATSPGSINQPTSATSDATLAPTRVPTAKPVQ